MASGNSDSDDDWHHSKRKSKRYSRSRSKSRDRHRSRKSKKPRHKHRSRSRSQSSGKQSRRRSRSHSSEYNSKRRGRRRSRSRSRSYSRSDHESRSQSSRSCKKSRSPSRRSSRSRDSLKSKGRKTSNDRGKETVNNAQLAEKKLQKALQAAVTADDILRAQGIIDDDVARTKTSQMSFEEQQKRASAINDIDSGEFVQESFKSSRSEIPLPTGSAVDASHTGAIFSGGPTVMSSVNTTTATKSCAVPNLSNSIMHPNLYIGVAEKMERWKQKVIELRKLKLAADGAV